MFARRQRQGLVIQRELLGGRIKGEWPAGKARMLTAAGTADEGDEARFQLRQFKRLGQKIVRALAQGAHPFDQGIARRQNQDGQSMVGFAQVSQHVMATQAGQTEVKYQRVVTRAFEGAANQPSVVDPVDLEINLLQRTNQPVGKLAFVFSQKDSHWLISEK